MFALRIQTVTTTIERYYCDQSDARAAFDVIPRDLPQLVQLTLTHTPLGLVLDRWQAPADEPVMIEPLGES